LSDDAGFVAGGENAGDIDDLAASRPWRERQPSPGDGGDDERKRYGPVIVADESEGSAQTSTLSRRF
jgi:hypothetical protein